MTKELSIKTFFNKKEHTEKIVQPSSWTFARYNYTPIEQRIKYAIMYLAQKKKEGIYETNIGKIEVDDHERHVLTIPFKVLKAGNNSNNNKDIKDAVDTFGTKKMTVNDNKGNILSIYPFIATNLNMVRGAVQIIIDSEVWKGFTQDANNYTEFDLIYALQMRSYISMRLYEIANTLHKPKTFEIENLIKMFCLEDKYKDRRKFVEKLEEAIKRDLQTTDFGLILKKNYFGENMHKLKNITLIPISQIQSNAHAKEIQKIAKERGLLWLFEPEELHILRLKFGFDEKGIHANVVTLKTAQEEMVRNSKKTEKFASFLENIYEKAKTKENPAGWLVDNLKRKFIA